MVDKDNKNIDNLDDDLDEDLLDDLGDPLVSNNKKSKKGDESLDPLDEEKKGNLLGKIFGKKNKANPIKKIEDGEDNSENLNGDDLLDETPKVSMATKKNLVVIVVIFLIIIYFIHAITKEKPNKRVDRRTLTEVQEMKQEFRDEAKIPSEAAIKKDQARIDEQKIAEIQSKANDPLAAIDVVSAPPPPPPSTYDPGEIFTKDNEIKPESANGTSADSNLDNVFEDDFGDDFSDIDDLELEEDFESDAKTEKAPPAVNYLVNSARADREKGGNNSSSNLPTLNSATGVSRNPNTANGTNPVAQDIQQQLSAQMFVSSNPDELPEELRNANQEGALDSEPMNLNQGIAVVTDRQQPYQLRDSTNNRRDVQLVRDMNNIILQGKVLDAIIETAINTDLPGRLRGVVARDVYAENGKKILIPKGSRLIGAYDTQIRFGQARVYIVWTRVIRPDGIDVVLDSREDMIAVDLLGRTGVAGELDNRFGEIFGSSILLSTLTIAFAYAADKVTDSARDITTTVSENGNVIESGPNISIAARQGVTDLANNLQRVARDAIDTRPRITIDQGTRIKVFVNKDLRFPPNFATNFKDQDSNEVMILR